LQDSARHDSESCRNKRIVRPATSYEYLRVLDLAQVVRGELDVGCGEVLLEPVRLGGARDRDDS
jgi:hypothetical protein